MASSPLTSPTIIRSGRIRRALTISLAIVKLVSSSSDLRHSRGRKCLFGYSRCRFISAASSIVITLWLFGMWPARIFNVVVLPEPVPPTISMFKLARTASARKSYISWLNTSAARSSSLVKTRGGNLRMDMLLPLMASPLDCWPNMDSHGSCRSGRQLLDLSCSGSCPGINNLGGDTFRRCSSSRKRTLVFTRIPFVSTYTSS